MNHYLSLTKKKLQNDNVTFSYEKVMKHKLKKLQMIVNSFLEGWSPVPEILGTNPGLIRSN